MYYLHSLVTPRFDLAYATAATYHLLFARHDVALALALLELRLSASIFVLPVGTVRACLDQFLEHGWLEPKPEAGPGWHGANEKFHNDLDTFVMQREIQPVSETETPALLRQHPELLEMFDAGHIKLVRARDTTGQVRDWHFVVLSNVQRHDSRIDQRLQLCELGYDLGLEARAERLTLPNYWPVHRRKEPEVPEPECAKCKEEATAKVDTAVLTSGASGP